MRRAGLASGTYIDYRRLSMNTASAMNIDRDTATEWASWFAALGDPTRVLILHLLSTEDRPLTVGEMTDRLDVGQSTVSHHLAKLADVGFVLVEQRGTSSLWRVKMVIFWPVSSVRLRRWKKASSAPSSLMKRAKLSMMSRGAWVPEMSLLVPCAVPKAAAPEARRL